MMTQSIFNVDMDELEKAFWSFLNWDNECVVECTLSESATEEAIEAFSIYKKQMKMQEEYDKKYNLVGFG